MSITDLYEVANRERKFTEEKLSELREKRDIAASQVEGLTLRIIEGESVMLDRVIAVLEKGPDTPTRGDLEAKYGLSKPQYVPTNKLPGRDYEGKAHV